MPLQPVAMSATCGHPFTQACPVNVAQLWVVVTRGMYWIGTQALPLQHGVKFELCQIAGPPGQHRRSSSGDWIDPGAIMSASAALRRTSRSSGSGQLTPSRPPPPPPSVAQAAAAAGGVVPQAQVSQHCAHPAGHAHMRAAIFIPRRACMQGTGCSCGRWHGACAS